MYFATGLVAPVSASVHITSLLKIMYILIDPSEKGKIKVVGFDENEVQVEIFDAPNREILRSLDSFLQKRNADKTAVQGIAVVVGVGGFTSTRLATTLGNAWHFAQKTPLLAVSLDEAIEPQKLITRFGSAKEYILAEYSGEPNVGKI